MLAATLPHEFEESAADGECFVRYKQKTLSGTKPSRRPKNLSSPGISADKQTLGGASISVAQESPQLDKLHGTSQTALAAHAKRSRRHKKAVSVGQGKHSRWDMYLGTSISTAATAAASAADSRRHRHLNGSRATAQGVGPLATPPGPGTLATLSGIPAATMRGGQQDEARVGRVRIWMDVAVADGRNEKAARATLLRPK
ncbi:DNA polymerase epsilon subunit D [Fonsecaea monophora]|uniref:DNA polymerase epsilon subunit D n=1 Tax=Fonsecaea monophora TaxID=254056 RepID=A0A177F440_9EURO|nr:DNA polymerase epsilon subunit D [Fonsecaea monophora]OAG39033.1 DNA polymerase epsilon subunit D [Fonsecaea monophora]